MTLAFKDAAFVSLQARRPSLFSGNLLPDWEHMRKFLCGLPPYDAAVMAKIWSGSLLTKSHRRTLNPLVSELCDCGEETQDINHLLWFCPLYPIGFPSELKWWHTLEQSASHALILPRGESLAFKKDWRRICKWALVVVARATKMHKTLTQDESDDSVPLPPSDVLPRLSANGHLVLSSSVPFAFCAKCFITRRERDRHYIPIKRCLKEDMHPCCEGEYKVVQRHLIRIEMHTWKQGSYRPRMVCQTCKMEQWATATFRSPCSKPLG